MPTVPISPDCPHLGLSVLVLVLGSHVPGQDVFSAAGESKLVQDLQAFCLPSPFPLDSGAAGSIPWW